MTPEDCARFLLSDCRDPVLRAQADRECDEDLAEALKDPVFKARWDAGLQHMADDIDARAMEYAYRDIRKGAS